MKPLKGHSKFGLKLIKDKEGYFVEKSGKIRLSKQCDKQILFSELIGKSTELKHLFESAKVIKLNYKEDIFTFTMPFYNGKNILDILERGDVTQLDDLIDKIFNFLAWEFKQCRIITDINTQLVRKIHSLWQEIMWDKTNKLFPKLLRKIQKKPIVIPTGICHGDFTFSNMIFGNKIILIDFLDSYIESPIQDIAKLLQELNLKWSLLMDDPQDRDLTKISIGYNYLRWEVTQRIVNEYRQYLKAIDLFYIVTLLRILPYVTDNKIMNVLTKEIEGIKL